MLQEFTFDLVPRSKPWALFLDIDGTMVEFAATPDQVIVPPELSPTLQRLVDESAGGLALVTGRPIESADRLFKPVQFTIAGLHGGEFRFDNRREVCPCPTAPETWKREAREMADAHPGVAYEEKRFGFSVHYREAPEQEALVKSTLEEMMKHDNPGFHTLNAAMAVEVRPDGVNKGAAIQRLMELPEFRGRHPLFFGDDTTDEDGFRTMRAIGGTSVVVGPRRPPDVEYCVRDPATMRNLLASLVLAP
jgi:trehalose 6-phosphate phosphatase